MGVMNALVLDKLLLAIIYAVMAIWFLPRRKVRVKVGRRRAATAFSPRTEVFRRSFAGTLLSLTYRPCDRDGPANGHRT